MQPETIEKVIEINRLFYQQFAGEFDETRQRLQPGVAGMLDELAGSTHILDLGCGNGTLYDTLKDRGFAGSYFGLDFSPALVRLSGRKNKAAQDAQFLVRDLAAPGWDRGLPQAFDCVLAFAVFHHLPPAVVQSVLTAVRRLLAPDGFLFHSNWHFLNSSRWRARIQPWEAGGIDPASVAPHDYLLDWRRGGTGLRYVHFYSEEELARLASQTGFMVQDTFFSDGSEGNLAIYQRWRPSSSPPG